MKRKNYIFSLASALLMGTMALSLTACSSEDIVANNTQQPAQGEVRTYTVSIPATFSDNAGTRAVAFDNSGTFFNHRGVRCYVVLHYELNKWLALAFKYSVSQYLDDSLFGTGYEELDSKHRQQWRLQLRLKL